MIRHEQVFELLSELSPRLPNFSRANWQSTVRTFASAHPDYADLTAWDGTESSDMYYDDVTGAFTALLIRQGYLDAMAWEGETPEYYIEVKATMAGSLETPFYLSKWQYNRVSHIFFSPSPLLFSPSFIMVLRRGVLTLKLIYRCKPCPTHRVYAPPPTGGRRSSTPSSGCTASSLARSGSSSSWTPKARGSRGCWSLRPRGGL